MADELTPTQRLLQLFDAAALCSCRVSVFEHSHPEAPSAIRSWAAARDFTLEKRDGKGFALLGVSLDGFDGFAIDVFLVSR